MLIADPIADTNAQSMSEMMKKVQMASRISLLGDKLPEMISAEINKHPEMSLPIRLMSFRMFLSSSTCSLPADLWGRSLGEGLLNLWNKLDLDLTFFVVA